MKASGLGAEPLQRPPLEESRELLNLSDAYLVSAYWSSIFLIYTWTPQAAVSVMKVCYLSGFGPENHL